VEDQAVSGGLGDPSSMRTDIHERLRALNPAPTEALSRFTIDFVETIRRAVGDTDRSYEFFSSTHVLLYGRTAGTTPRVLLGEFTDPYLLEFRVERGAPSDLVATAMERLGADNEIVYHLKPKEAARGQ
jgi:hypothetical protein